MNAKVLRIVGDSGSGKSSALNALYGLLKSRGDKVLLASGNSTAAGIRQAMNHREFNAILFDEGEGPRASRVEQIIEEVVAGGFEELIAVTCSRHPAEAQIDALAAQRDQLLAALEGMIKLNSPLRGNPSHGELVEEWKYEKRAGNGAAEYHLAALAAIAAAKGGAA